MQVSQSYGISRPVAIAVKVAALQARFMPIAAIAVEVSDAKKDCEDYRDYRAKVQDWQIERTDLRIQRAELLQYRQTEEVQAELKRIEARLQDLDDFLIFEEDCDFDATPYDEFDADLPDELDGSFSSSYGLSAA